MYQRESDTLLIGHGNIIQHFAKSFPLMVIFIYVSIRLSSNGATVDKNEVILEGVEVDTIRPQDHWNNMRKTVPSELLIGLTAMIAVWSN